MKTAIFTIPLIAMALVLSYLSLLWRPWSLLFLWPAVVLVIVSAAYGFRWHGVFGKRLDGRLPLLRVLLLLPYLAPAWLTWRIRKWVWQEKAWTKIDEDLYLGRRLSNREMPDKVDLVVDLTAEFRERPNVRVERQYLCLPTLDGTAPETEAFIDLVKEVSDFAGRAYVHCAVGYGRSATVVAGVMLRRGLVQTPGQAVHRLQTLRPGVAIGRGQYRLLERTVDRLRNGRGDGPGQSM